MDKPLGDQLNEDTRTYPKEQQGSKIQVIAESSFETLRNSKSKKKILLLHGRPHSGKKSVVNEFLSLLQLNSSNEELCLALREESAGVEDINLPVMAISARSRDQNGLAKYVRAFLHRIHDIRNNLKPNWLTEEERQSNFQPDVERYHTELANQHREAGSAVSVERTLAEISRLSEKHAALFVITDIEGFERDSVLKLLRGYDISSLLQILNKNPHNRIVATARDQLQQSLKDTAGWEIRTLEEKLVPDPEFGRLPNYWKVSPLSEEIRARLNDRWQELEAELSFSQTQKETEGSMLVVCAAVIQLCSQNDEFECHLDDAIKHILAFAKVPTGSQRTFERRALIRFLIMLIEKCGLLSALALICVSEDGILASTLKFSLERWKEQSSQTFSCFDHENLPGKLEEFSKLASQFLLMQDTNARIDEHEFGLDETSWDLELAITDEFFSPADVGSGKGLLHWTLDPVIRIYILEELQQQGPDQLAILRGANRLVSRAARRRAQHKKINLPTPFSMRPQLDAARDIQSYVNLLASIDGTQVKKGVSCGTSLRLASDDIFAINKNFEPTAALRFAYSGLMREDIDRDFRLSMVTDQDSLRLRLYLLLLMPLGRQHFWRVEDLHTDGKTVPHLPNSIPKHLQHSLSLEQIISLCTTIVVSAYYSNHQDKLGYIAKLAVTYAASKGIDPEHEKETTNTFVFFKLARIWLTQIDGLIAAGTKNDKALIEVRKILKFKIFTSLKPDTPRQWTSFYKDENKRPILISWMRMRFREAELLDRAGKSNEAWQILDELVKFDNFISSENNSVEPVILSGRTARRFIKCVYGDPLIQPNKKISTETSDTARLLMEVNIARLRRFSGVDRIGVLVDLARRHAREGDLQKAIGYITKANIRIRNAPVSDLGKAELLVCLASIRILCATNDNGLPKSAKVKFLKKAGENAKRILQLNKRAGSNLLQAKGQFILATSDYYRARDKSKLTEPDKQKLTNHVSELGKCLEKLKRDKDVRYAKEIRKLLKQIDGIGRA